MTANRRMPPGLALFRVKIRIGLLSPRSTMISAVIVLALLTLLVATDANPSERRGETEAQRDSSASPACPRRAIGPMHRFASSPLRPITTAPRWKCCPCAAR